MIKKNKIILTAILSLATAFSSAQSFASADAPSVNNTANKEADLYSQSAIKIPWASLGFNVIKYLGNTYLFSREATSNDYPSKTTVSSGTIGFNNKGNSGYGASAKHDVHVDYAKNEIDAFGQTSLLNWLDKISIIITDSSGNDVVSSTATHNQHVNYSAPNSGWYTVRWVNTAATNWDLWVQVWKFGEPGYPTFYKTSPNNTPQLIRKTDGKEVLAVEENNGKTYILPSKTHKNYASINKKNSLTAKDLYNQLYDNELKEQVSVFKDFVVGDNIIFEDEIQSVSFDSNNNYTILGFKDASGDILRWAFNGNLTKELQANSKIMLQFKVVQDIGTFETLDYLKEARESKAAPSIEKYIVKK
ncbi:hypothetical protein NLX71_10550 [Paenibacillus sp. MZ04-78.2]|uniref:hypothetical protein n=1 Tax=Paenibacillus sp. MZ04-78.2 TaxID=2962034 RepID=UPI0020B8D45E|nr:hypothetical protein [Paenibacillus sp. MZ04-78.2]MCP3773751.1 hypothetical protein [Paenibacillus sp. MZ04-78.2]